MLFINESSQLEVMVVSRKIQVFDFFKITHKGEWVTILVTEPFSDSEITKTIRSNIGQHTEFQIEHLTQCFSDRSNGVIGFFGAEVFSQITEFEFV